jgi:hypothetical protein
MLWGKLTCHEFATENRFRDLKVFRGLLQMSIVCEFYLLGFCWKLVMTALRHKSP